LASDLLSRGTETTDRVIILCNCIRQCALSLMSMEGADSDASVAAMVVRVLALPKQSLSFNISIFYANHHIDFKAVAKEARKMCEWMVATNELYDSNSYTLSHEMGLCDTIRISTIDVMKYILSSSRGYDLQHFLVWVFFLA
jgi:hypothetical protein